MQSCGALRTRSSLWFRKDCQRLQARLPFIYDDDDVFYAVDDFEVDFQGDDDNDKTDAGDDKGDDVDNDDDNVQLLLLLSSFPSFESCSFAQVPIDDLSRSNWQKPLKVCGASQR